MIKQLALVVDDEVDICELLELTLIRMGVEAKSANDLQSAYDILQQFPITFCLTDMRLPDGEGQELVKVINQQYPNIPVAMISAHGNMEHAIEAMKLGAFDFVSKPVILSELRHLINTAIQLSEYSENEEKTSATIANKTVSIDNSKELIGHSKAMTKVCTLINKLARSLAPVQIYGESGTGKELAARLIHQQSPRKNAPFIPINCGAIPHDLVESEFFGYKKGSFTGAVKDKAGLFQMADGGTLFLDEIADLPLNMQVKLLRVIQEKAVKAIGDHEEKKIDVRIISATHKNLKQLVTEEKFRQDLYYRINVIELIMPNLRNCKEDIIPLAENFLRRLSPQSEIKHLSDESINKLINYHFPGNVRELENILERAVALCDSKTIEAVDLLLSGAELPVESTQIKQETATEASPLPSKEKIVATLNVTKWNRKVTAQLLGITYRQLRYRLKKLGLE